MSQFFCNFAADMNYWNTVITPKDRLLTIDWKEIWRYRDMYSLFVERSFKTAYKQTVLGPLWFIITPVIEALSMVRSERVSSRGRIWGIAQDV